MALGLELMAVLQRRSTVTQHMREQLMRLQDGVDQQSSAAEACVNEIASNVWVFSPGAALDVLRELADVARGRLRLFPSDESVRVDSEATLLRARSAAHRLSILLGANVVQRTKIATAVSELARNILMYAGSGEIDLLVHLCPEPALEVRARDRGPGIARLDEILAGTYRSKSGLGLGLRGVKSISDTFSVTSRPGETEIRATFRSSAAPGRTSQKERHR